MAQLVFNSFNVANKLYVFVSRFAATLEGCSMFPTPTFSSFEGEVSKQVNLLLFVSQLRVFEL